METELRSVVTVDHLLHKTTLPASSCCTKFSGGRCNRWRRDISIKSNCRCQVGASRQAKMGDAVLIFKEVIKQSKIFVSVKCIMHIAAENDRRAIGELAISR